MSLFKTEIPIQLAEFLKVLPKGSHIEAFAAEVIEEASGIGGKKTLNTDPSRVFVVWGNEQWESGRLYPVDYPMDLLAKGKAPKTAYKRAEYKKQVAAANEPKNAPEVKPAIKTTDLPAYLTEEQVREGLKNGEAMEFWGINPGWKVVDLKTHHYTEGFYYRKVVLAATPEPVAI